MEPFDREEMTDRELAAMLAEWKAPEAPARLRAAVFDRAPWWRRFWSASIHIPVPVACALLLLAGAAAWLWPNPAPKPAAPRVIVETKTVEVPVVKERIIYRDVPQKSTGWRPVAELRPRIIRGGRDEN